MTTINKISSNAKSCVLDFLNPKDLREMSKANKGWHEEATKPLTIARVLCHSDQGFGSVAKVCELLTNMTLYVAEGILSITYQVGLVKHQSAVLTKSGYDLSNEEDINFHLLACPYIANFMTGKDSFRNKNEVTTDICPSCLPMSISYGKSQIHLSLENRHIVVKLEKALTKLQYIGFTATPGAWDEDPTLENLKSIFYLGHLKKLEAPKNAENDKKENAKS